jgi:glyoxylase-like metal-dependent hydrolase (beta-lactamase superfamily II)
MKQNFTKALTVIALTAFTVIPIRAAELDTGGIDVVKVRNNFYMIAGGGGNVGVQIGSDGVVLVGAGAETATTQMVAAIKKLTPLPVRYIIDINADADFVGGNEKLAKAGFTIFTNAIGNAGVGGTMTNGGAAAVLAHQSILNRMSARDAKPSYPGDAWPTEAFLQNRHAMRMNDEGIEVLYQPAAHSDADSFVLFRKSDVVVAGDIMDTTRFPVIDLAHGGSIQGEIDALDKLIDLTIAPIPYIYKDVGTYVVPGHGRLCEQMEVVDYRDMIVSIKDVIEDYAKQGKTLAQIQALHPALPYETRFGSTTGAWTTNMFVEAVYKSLTAKK